MRMAVVGGGPGGLFAATLAKACDPTREVVVFERHRAEDTFGFGVVFSDATLEGIHSADPVLRTALDEHGVHWDTIEVRLRGQRYACRGNGMAAVERRTLLSLLQQRAVAAGVDIRFSTPIDPDALLASGYDLVVAADGANSPMRERFGDVFASTVHVAAAKFIWLGTTLPFDGLTFVHERGPDGVFAVHGYPIGGGVSTFIVETDEQSWRAAGLDAFDVKQAPGPSDERSRDYLQAVFADVLGDHRLLVNNSRWGSFGTRRTGRWRHRVGGTGIALLGDSAHTAHFSVGSGTKMAMEDAVALARALDEHPQDVDAALVTYEDERQPHVAKIQDSAGPSLSWWEHFGRSYEALPPWQFAYHFFTRSLTDTRLRRRDDAFVVATHDRWQQEHGAQPLDTPLEVAGQTLPGRRIRIGEDGVLLPQGTLPLLVEPAVEGTPWGLRVHAPPAEGGLTAVLEDVAKAVAGGAALVAVEAGSALTRRLVCEAARLEHGAIALLIEGDDSDRAEDLATTAVLSGRCDAVGAYEVLA